MRPLLIGAPLEGEQELDVDVPAPYPCIAGTDPGPVVEKATGTLGTDVTGSFSALVT